MQLERNRELFEKIAAQIEETPDRWDQSHWATEDEVCGTKMCVAGWAAELTCGLIEIKGPWDNKPILAPAARDERQPHLGFDYYGEKVLGLTVEDAHEMFYGSWDEEFETVHEAAEFLRAFGRGEARFGPSGGIVWDRP